ncbi:MAG: protein-glutamate O-methyltransferase CheR [Pirellulaceae bacterium]
MNQPLAAPAVKTSLQEVSDSLLSKYAALIYEVTGIRISPQKKALLSNRLRRRLRATGIADFEAYYKHLKSIDVRHDEWDHFLQEITTHETYLFRDESNWTWFQNEFLPGIAAEAEAGQRQRSLRIWSAACSTGDEAYTAASCIVAKLPGYQRWNVKILGTDIGVGAVAHAKNAEFGARAMRLTPADIQQKCFEKKAGELWKPKAPLTQLVEFQQHNLLAPLRHPPFDLVFLKNVLIYFDNDSKRVVIDNIRKMLRPGGLLVAGAAEGVADLLKDFQRIQPWLFQMQ